MKQQHQQLNHIFQNGDTALHIAAAMGRRKLTRVLLESGCDRDMRNKQNERALDIAQRKNLVDIVQILTSPPPSSLNINPSENYEQKVQQQQQHHQQGKSVDDTDIDNGEEEEDDDDVDAIKTFQQYHQEQQQQQRHRDSSREDGGGHHRHRRGDRQRSRHQVYSQSCLMNILITSCGNFNIFRRTRRGATTSVLLTNIA